VVDVGLNENGAAFAHARRLPGGKRQTVELAALEVHAEPLGLFLDETAGAGGADLVHREVHDRAIVETDELRVLAADLEDRVDALIDLGRRRGVGGDLVLDDVGPDEVARQVSA